MNSLPFLFGGRFRSERSINLCTFVGRVPDVFCKATVCLLCLGNG